MSFSDYTEAAVLNSIFGKTSDFGALASAPTVYVALCTAGPSDSDTGSTITEAGYTSYARVSTSASDWNASSSSTVDNANVITFPTSTGGSATVTHFAICDASSGGNLLAYGALDSSVAVATSDRPEFAAGDLNFTLA